MVTLVDNRAWGGPGFFGHGIGLKSRDSVQGGHGMEESKKVAGEVVGLTEGGHLRAASCYVYVTK